MEQIFPVLDRYSMPLLILLAQGFVFVILISVRYFQKRNLSDLLLSSFLLLFCYERIHYAVGFMAWYDSFPTTKINYFLFPMTLAFGPLLFFYVTSLTKGAFKMKPRNVWHFIPFICYLLYRTVLYVVDSHKAGFDSTQNGELMSSIEFTIVSPIMILFTSFHLLLYLAFSIQLYWFYRLKIKEFYSNTYRLELNWIRSFLVLFGFLFLYDVFQNLVDSFIVELHWSQKWWYHALSSAVIVYFGIRGYFTNTDKLQDLSFSFMPEVKTTNASVVKHDYQKEVIAIRKHMEINQPFLDPSLNLRELAGKLSFSSAQLSAIINDGFDLNFNDFINTYRVNAVKKALQDQKQESHSLVGIAYDCGFNSKATFNRVFKKLTSVSPTEYIASLK